MSYGDSNQRIKSNQYLRITMDIGMGMFYSIIGAMIVVMRSFANIKIPNAIAFVLGGMMLIGGLYRLYKGIKALLPQGRDADQ